MHSENKVVSDGAFVAESEEMCNLSDEFEEMTASRGTKRKLIRCDFDDIYIPPKRISPFLNTPKEKKEEKRKILKISIKKLKEIDNAELCLRRSVLIQNTVRRLQRELREDKLANSRHWCDNTKPKRKSCPCSLSTNYLKNSLLYDDPVITDTNDKISDDMTDTLMKNLEEKIGGRLACISSIENNGPRMCVTPVPRHHDETGNTDNQSDNVATRSVKTCDSEESLETNEGHSVSISINAKFSYSDSEKPLISSEIDNQFINLDKASFHNLSHECSPLRVDVKAERTTHEINSLPPLSNSNLVSNSGNHDILSHTFSLNESDTINIDRNGDETMSDNHMIHQSSDNLNSDREREKMQCDNVLDVTLRHERSSFSEKPLLLNHDSAKEDHIQSALKLNPVLVSG